MSFVYRHGPSANCLENRHAGGNQCHSFGAVIPGRVLSCGVHSTRPSTSIRSGTTVFLHIPKTRTSTGSGKFTVTGVVKWNSLPAELRILQLLNNLLAAACLQRISCTSYLIGAVYKCRLLLLVRLFSTVAASNTQTRWQPLPVGDIWWTTFGIDYIYAARRTLRIHQKPYFKYS